MVQFALERNGGTHTYVLLRFGRPNLLSPRLRGGIIPACAGLRSSSPHFGQARRFLGFGVAVAATLVRTEAKMTSTPHNELAALKKVAVDFGGHLHFFRLVPQYTFSHLLVDAAKHWMLDADDYELQDEDGSTWPSAGS